MADVSVAADARRAIDGAAVVFHAAQPAYHRWPEDFPAITTAVLAAAASAGAAVVLADNLYAYGPAEGPLTEREPAAATDRKGAFRASMFAEMLKEHRAEGSASPRVAPRITSGPGGSTPCSGTRSSVPPSPAGR